MRANGAAFLDQAYVDAYWHFLDNTQDPVSGYWGPWIKSEGEIIRTADLSQTFHAISYRKGSVDHWPEIIETTLSIKDLPYPFGWKHNGQYNNHNNYDVVKILRFGWSHMTTTQIDQARAEIRSMLMWAVEKSVTLDGEFRNDPSFDNSIGETYYYGVSFLDEVGYWDKDQRFWDSGTTNYAGAQDLCRKILRHLTKLQTNSIPAQEALLRMNKSCRVAVTQ